MYGAFVDPHPPRQPPKKYICQYKKLALKIAETYFRIVYILVTMLFSNRKIA